MAELQAQVERFANQKEILAPAVADWQQGLKETADAQAAVASLAAQTQRLDSDIAQAEQRLEEVNRTLGTEEKRRAELER